MHEVLQRLGPDDRGLDLGSGPRGSFAARTTRARVVRIDLDRPSQPQDAPFVQCAAERLPFRDGAFRAVISNHTLEHFPKLDEALDEVGRVVDEDGWFYAAVPDASTLSDKIYRWLGRGGGHVNPFVSRRALEEKIERATGLPAAGGRLLYASWSFLNRRNIPGRRQLKLWLFAGGSETFVRGFGYRLRRLDAWLGTRLAIYGWALYFGRGLEVEPGAWSNVCVRCGAGRPAKTILPKSGRYRCPACGAPNRFTPDRA